VRVSSFQDKKHHGMSLYEFIRKLNRLFIMIKLWIIFSFFTSRSSWSINSFKL